MLRSKLQTIFLLLLFAVSILSCSKEAAVSYSAKDHEEFARWLVHLELANGDYEYFLDQTCQASMKEAEGAAKKELKRELESVEKKKLNDLVRATTMQIYSQTFLAKSLAPLYQGKLSATSLVQILEFFETPAGEKMLQNRHVPELNEPEPNFQKFTEKYLGEDAETVMEFLKTAAGEEYLQAKEALRPELEKTLQKIVKDRLSLFRKRFLMEFKNIFKDK